MKSPAIDLSDCFAPAPKVMAREVGEHTVLLDLASGRYFELNATGRHIWALLVGGASLAGTLDRLAAEFAAPRERLMTDLLELVARLEGEGLIARRSPGEEG